MRAPEVGVAVVLTCSGSPVQSSAVLLTRYACFAVLFLYSLCYCLELGIHVKTP